MPSCRMFLNHGDTATVYKYRFSHNGDKRDDKDATKNGWHLKSHDNQYASYSGGERPNMMNMTRTIMTYYDYVI